VRVLLIYKRSYIFALALKRKLFFHVAGFCVALTSYDSAKYQAIESKSRNTHQSGKTESGSWKYIHIGQCVTSIQKQKVTKSKHKSKVGTLKVEKSYHHLQ
jgi:hypothetical protein